MTRKFLITGLPRSRTAWLAVAATRGGVVCHHEPSAWLKDPDALTDLWNEPHDAGGISDSALGIILPDILKTHRPRTLIIVRPPEAVGASVAAYLARGGVTIDRTLLARRLHRLGGVLASCVDHPLVRAVDFESLCHIEVVKNVLEWLTPGAPPPGLLGQLMHMNVQSDLDYNLAMAATSRQWWMPADL